jgi:hypothetical protein
MKKYKIALYKTKWSFLLPFYILQNKAFRDLYLSTHFTTQSLPTLKTRLRTLLRLNPRWTYGHYLLGIISFRLFQYSNEGSNKGTLQLSLEAIHTLCDHPSEREHTRKTLLECLMLFLKKEYQTIIDTHLSEPVKKSIATLRDSEKALFFEATGFSNLVMGKDTEAKHSFLSIPPYVRTGEISAAITNLERSSPA